jgi:hypothetical protein
LQNKNPPGKSREKQASRRKAEDLINSSSVIRNDVYQDKSEIIVIFKLSNDCFLMINYDIKKRAKTFFIDQLKIPKKNLPLKLIPE